ncbi:carboxypeptidase-like regulatory domain-containing protein [Salinibaculum salinum]|uniref:carboxypeptidase-like regulatory domain-containing protein n=1 Tax=Salinibaculum salinum TaxID=3131996 RepID=UPI0030ECDF2F
MLRLSAGVVTTLLVVSVLAPGAIGGATAQDDTVTVTVAVVDSNGDSVGDVDISVTWNGGEGGPINETTAGNGKAFVDVPRGADLEIEIDDDEYVRNSPFVKFNAAEEEIRVPVSLSGQATLTVESEDGPVSNADLTLLKGSNSVESVSTNESGEATTRRLERGNYGLRVEKPGFLTNNSEIALTGVVEKRVTLERGTVSVDFSVVDNNFDEARPVENATVSIPQIGYSSRTFDNGETSTSVRVNREYTAEVSKDEYETVSQRFTVEEEPVSVDIAISRADTLNVRSANNRVVVGESTRITVTDEYGDPVPNAAVRVGGQSASRTNDDGETDVTINATGNVTVTVSDAGLSASVTVEGVETGSDPTPTATPTPDSSTPSPEPTETDEMTTEPEETAGDSGPGFGIAVTLAALAGVLALARHR